MLQTHVLHFGQRPPEYRKVTRFPPNGSTGSPNGKRMTFKLNPQGVGSRFHHISAFQIEKFTYNRTANEVELKLPATFGKYELLKQIGSGGMAEIYLARAFGVAG